jgi:hypothetical protein
MAVVYWLHLPEHTDIASQGYIGVSKNTAKSRFKSHKCSANRGSPYPVHRAIRKYRDKIVLSTILSGAEDYCYLIEGRLRPSPGIGWNIALGGVKANMSGRRHSEATRQHLSEVRKAVGLSKERMEAMKAGIKKPRNFPVWNNSKANKLVWLEAEHLFKLFKSQAKCGHKLLAKLSGVFTSDNLETITAKFKSGWNPCEDATYQEWKAVSNRIEATNG